MKFNFKYKGKEFNLEVKECKTFFSKVHGLMFKKNSKPLLFIFSKSSKEAIHSFFCVPFIAIWFNKKNIVDIKVVRNRKFFIRPQKNFDKLLEIPSNTPYFNEFYRRYRNL